jgi:hypothetical protein
MVFRLPDDIDNILQNDLIVVYILFCAERVNKIIEQANKAKERLSAYTQVDIFRQVDEVRQHYMQPKLISAIFPQ